MGKTDLAIKLALEINGEIVSVDSRQIYRYMDIGTAKPTPEQLGLVPHYMVDCVTPDDPFSAADYQKGADNAIEEITKRGKIPILVGGSGLYFRALVDGLFEGPESDKDFRQSLRQEAEESGIQVLYDRLKVIDPEDSEKIHHNDLMRIIRALEVYDKSGRRISELQKQWGATEARYKFLAFGLNLPRDELYRRIETRLDQMMSQGFLDEALSLLKYSRELPAMNCLGYKELFLYLDGSLSLDEAIQLIKRNTRRYSKRQLTWFRKDKRIKWIDLSLCNSTVEAISFITRLFYEYP